MAEAGDFKAALQDKRITAVVAKLARVGDVARAKSLVRQVCVQSCAA
jgi:hypothetical protein